MAYAEFQKIRHELIRKEVVERISSKHGITKSTVYQWFKGVTPTGKRAGTIAKVPELLYVLGALLGDGCPYFWRNTFQVWLVGEAEFTAKFAMKLSACLGRSVSHYKYGSKNAWFVRVENAELYFLFKSVRKDHSLIKKIVGEIDPEGGWKEFVNGFFDAEGCVKIIRGKERRTPKVCLDFCNTDLSLLLTVQDALRDKLDIESGLSIQRTEPPRKTAYHLRVYSKENIKKFLSIMSTTKLTEGKRPLVEAWLTKRV